MKLVNLATISKVWQHSSFLLKPAAISDNGRIYKVRDGLIHRIRYTFDKITKMATEEDLQIQFGLVPPESVRGMTELCRESFTKKVNIPGIKIPKKKLALYDPFYKPVLLRIKNVNPIAELGESDPLKATHRLVLLDPVRLTTKTLKDDAKEALGLTEDDPNKFEVELSYENWHLTDIMRAVLPKETENVSAFSQIGHIAHINLKPEVLPYKHLVGQVIVDKTPSVKTVVNKLNEIDNTFRTFKMELLAGEENYIARVNELGCTFELDFSKVYWNPRLSRERERILDEVESQSFVYDVFAGVGPFAISLARKRKCSVFANDLNPSSFEYLQKNIVHNKTKAPVLPYNLDGREFIRTTVKNHLIKTILDVSQIKIKDRSCSAGGDSSNIKPLDNNVVLPISEDDLIVEDDGEEYTLPIPKTYVLMNLPGLAVEFLDAFNLLLSDLPHAALCKMDRWRDVLPKVMCYSFVAKVEDQESIMKSRAEAALGKSIPGSFEMRIVRNVAPNKDMVCIIFNLWSDLLLGKSDEKTAVEDTLQKYDEPECKRQKLSS